MPPTIEMVNPSIREQYNSTLISREDRRENLNNVPSQCSAQCGKILPRGDLKVCSRCKEARYCSQACQKAHWRAGHKSRCAPPGDGPLRNLPLKLAERALAVPKIVEYLTMHSILTLELLTDRTNSNRFAVRVQCSTGPADITAYLRHLMSRREKDPNSQVVLSVSSITRVPFSETPERTRHVMKDAQARLAVHGGADADQPLVTFFFTSEESPDDDGSLSVARVVPESALKYMANNPTSTVRSSMLGDQEYPLDAELLRDGLNNFMRMDKENKLRLRAYPTTTKPEPEERAAPIVIYEE